MAAATAAAVAAAATVAGTAYSMSQGSGGSAPRPPNYTKQIVKGTAAESMVLPDKIRGELAARQQFDMPSLLQNLAYMQASNTGVQTQRLDAAEKFAPSEIAANRSLLALADPNRVETRDEVGRMVLEELQKGRELSTTQSLGIKDAIRGRQVVNGITDGSMPVIDEALAIERYKDEVRARRLSDAGNFLAMPSLAEMSAGLPTGYSPMQPGETFRLFDPRAGQSAADYASRGYATQVNAPQQPNGWMQGLGMLAGAAGRYAGWSASQPTTAPAQTGRSGATNSWINLG